MMHLPSRRLHTCLLVILLGLLVIATGWLPAQIALAESNPAAQLWQRLWSVGAQRFSADPVRAAWERVQTAGSYHFTSDVVQITIPTAKVTNVGRPSRTEQIHLEGQNDLQASAAEFHLWSEGGSILDTKSGLTVRVADGKSYTRQGTGAWQESSSVTDAIAPEGDFMGYLAAARDITPHEPETRAGIAFIRYSFQIDGPTFAAFSRNQLEAAMRARGELPEGVHFDLPTYYRDMTGDGELWVRADGLPLRQLLNLRFPEQNDSTVQAQIKVDFSQFGQSRFVGGEFVQVDPTVTTGGFASMLKTLQRQAATFGALLALLPILGLAALVVAYRRKRTLQVAISLAVIASMVVGPLLNTLKMTTFLDAQTARAAEQSATQKESAMLRDLRAMDSAPQFNPNQNPLEAAAAAPALAPAMAISAAPANAPLLQATSVLTVETGLDTDGDLLTDFVEQRIGSSATISDTDGDLILDKIEVDGFTRGGQTWYSDPLNFDSNDDGLADTEEWGNLIATTPAPPDTDGDGTPDLFEGDNDNDRVPDRLDLAPFSTTPMFTSADPFQLTINNMSVGKPTFVDLQLRPNDPNNLWAAGNVLDWPQDNQGQVQDVDGKSYADYAAANNLAVAQNDSFGDLKLTPMLEIRVPSDSANLPSKELLQAYQILYNDLDTNSAEKLLYVPLTVVSDQKTGARVAFAARMRYERASTQQTWLNPHQMRLVWTVQVLQDVPCDPADGSTVTPPCVDGYRHNVPQVIHSYTDDWTLTGINVREEQGTKMALAYEDPAVDADAKDETALTMLAMALEGSFLEGRDCDNPDTIAKVCRGDGQRDLKIADLHDRFDRTSSNRPPVNDPKRLGFDGALDILTVETPTTYNTLDWALTQTVTRTQNVLSQFAPNWQSDNAVKPLLMYAYETAYRSLGLDARRGLIANANRYVALNGSQLAFDLQPSGLDPTPIQTTTGMKWTAYCAAAGSTPTWDTCDPVDYWQTLENRYGSTIASVFPDAVDADVARGRLALVQLFWLTLAQGVQRVVANQLNDLSSPEELVILNPSYEFSDHETNADIRDYASTGRAAVVFGVNNRVVEWGFKDVTNSLVLRNVGRTFNGKASFGALDSIKRAGGKPAVGVSLAIGFGLVATGAALTKFGNASQQRDGNILLQSILIGVTGATQVLPAAMAVVSAARGAAAGSRLATAGAALASRSEVVGLSRFATGVGTAIAIGITWGFFVADVVGGEIKPGTLAFNVALATTIGTTIYIVLLAVLSLTLVGLILVGLLTLFDQVATLFCETKVVDRQKDGSCFTIGGAFAKAVGDLIYSYAPLIKTKDPKLVVAGIPGFALSDPTKGFVVGSTAIISLPVTTTVQHTDPPSNALKGYTHYLSAENLKKTTFKRTLSTPNEAPVTANPGEMSDAWGLSVIGQWCIPNTRAGGCSSTTPLYKAANTTPVSAMVTFATAGLNRIPPLYLNTGYALPAYDCWGVEGATKCNKKTIQGQNSAPFNPFQFDIFPATVGEFAAITSKSGGFALRWDPAFTALWDADGDGLLSPVYNGNDPDDSSWDRDGDGLADAFELELRLSGVEVNPFLADTDADGLTDRQEQQYRTDPANADTDNDGLTDGVEVAGWTISVAGINHPLRVFSDPTQADSDSDAINDKAEKALAASGTPLDSENRPYHPTIFNSSPIKVYSAIDGRTGPWFIKPGQVFDYETTVLATTPLAPSVLDVTVPAGLGQSPPPRRLAFDTQTFSGTQTIVQTEPLTADSGLNTQTAVLNSTVRARLAPSAPANWQWDAFNPAVVNTLFPQRFLTANAFQANRSDRYLLGTVTSDSSSLAGGGQGVVNAQVYPDSWPNVVDTSDPRRPANDASVNPPAAQDTVPAALRGFSSHNVACNDSGQCLVVWEKSLCKTITLSSIKVVTAGSDGGGGIEPLVYFVADANDTDPTNGGYELIWDGPSNGGDNMASGQTRTTGFPKAIEVCDPGRIDIYEATDATFSYDDPTGNLTTWNNLALTNGFYIDRDGIDCARSLSGAFGAANVFPCPAGQTTGRNFGFNGAIKVAQVDGAPNIELSTTLPTSKYHVIQGAIVSANSAGSGLDAQPVQPLNLSNTGSFAPVVASDGTNFVVAYEQANKPFTFLSTVRVDANGTVSIGQDRLIENTTRVADNETNGVALDLVWSGNRYTLAYKVIDSGIVTIPPMYLDVLDGNGVSQTGGFQILHSGPGTSQTPEVPAASAAGRPVLVYDPISSDTLLFFANISSLVRWTKINGLVPGAVTFSRPDFLRLDGVNLTNVFFGGFDVAYNPMVNGWLIARNVQNDIGGRSTATALMNNALSAPIVAQTNAVNSVGGRPAAACPVLVSRPAVDLRFEELPGPNLSINGVFADSSIFGRTATCDLNNGTGCPLTGAPGATKSGGNPVGNPASDYAVTFDNVNDRLILPNPITDGMSLAFWYKVHQGIGGLLFGGGSNNFTFSTAGNSFTFSAGGVNLTGSAALANGTWHHVVATRASGSGALKVYIDDNPNPVAAQATSPVLTAGANVTIDSTSGDRMSLDNLRLYRTALDPTSVQQLYNGEVAAYCAVVQGTFSVNTSLPNQLTLAQLNVSQPDTRGGALTASGGLSFTIDADAPTAQVTALANNGYIKGEQGTPTVVTIGGTAADPTTFVSKVEVNVGSGWQVATGLDAWVVQLSLSEGAYTLSARATDTVGNLGAASAPRNLIVDGTPPTIGITSPSGATLVPNGNAQTGWTVALAGAVTDPVIGSNPGSGVAAVEVTLQSQATGKGYALQKAALPNAAWNINYAFPSDLVDPSGSYTLTVTAEDKVGNRSVPLVSTFRLDTNGPEVELSPLDLARRFISETLTINGVISDTGGVGVAGLEINFQSVEAVAATPAGTPVAQALAQVTWTPVTLAQSGAGVASSVWSFAIPADLESEYQINLRSKDTQNNVRLHPNVWRGIIDTQAPRVSMVATLTSPPDGVLVDVGGGFLSRAYQFQFTCFAEDRYLSEPDFACTNGETNGAVRSFNTNPLLQQIFPDRTILDRLTSTYARWFSSLQLPATTVAACDVFGHCSTANVTTQNVLAAASAALNTDALNAAAVNAVAAGAPLAAVISPLQGQYVASTGNLAVTLVAEAAAGLQQVTLTLDGALIQTLTFAQSENITNTQRTLAVAVTGEVTHTLVAKATDWAGTVQQTLYPVRFTLDTQLPTVTLDTNLLGLAQTWGLGSDVLRFHGTASDSVGLAAVQIKIGDAPFAEATFDETTHAWYTAQLVPDPEGKTLAVRVRAIDRAGRITEVTGNIGVELTTTNPPETVITAQPSNLSSANSADFSFTGTDGAGNALSAFGCRLDDGEFLPCGSPQSYPELSNGLHRFAVRAIDDEGFVDPTPASVEWTVEVAALQTALTQSPSNPTESRTATFAFSGSNGVTGFECALDDAAYTPCSSPQSYAGLSDGAHTFQVRGLNSAGTKGAATRFTWTVVNAAPLANSQAVTTTENLAINVLLTATDNDALSYVVGSPVHGVLLGTPPNLTYSPDSKFFGTDSFTFIANDGLLSSNVATVTIMVKAADNIPPETTISSTPANPTVNPDASFVFTGTDNLKLASFACSLDNAAFAPCTSPKTYTALADGSHTFQVRAVDSAGNVDLTPASYSWGVQRGTIVGICGGFTVIQKAANNFVAPGWSGAIKVGTSGNNTLTGSAGRDLMLGLAGNDSLNGQTGDDVLCGDDGVDLVQGLAGNDVLEGGIGNDVLNGGTGDYDVLLAGDGNDAVLDGDGVSNASGGAGNDLLTIALRNGWRDGNGQARFTGLAAGYGNDAVGLAILGTVRFFLDITGDERDNPASPLEGNGDALALVGVIDPASTIIKFERRTGVTSANADEPVRTEITVPGEDEGADYLSEAVGGNDVPVNELPVREIPDAVQPSKIYLPLISSGTVGQWNSGTVDSETVDSETVNSGTVNSGTGGSKPEEEEAQNNTIFLPTVSR